MRTYESTEEAAARLRGLFKREGWTARDVSVRVESYSMGSNITATIRSARVSSKRVRVLLESAESIYRDESGEILSGGNRFTYLRWNEAVRAELAAPYLSALVSAVAALGVDPVGSALAEIAGTRLKLGRDGRNEFRVWGPEGPEFGFWAPKIPEAELKDAAFRLAVLIQEKYTEEAKS